MFSLFPLLLHTGLHRRFIYPPSIFPPGHQHFVDCFCFATAFLGLFVKCWSVFCVRRLTSCEGSGAHCVLLATWNRTENKMSLCFYFFLCLFPPEQLNLAHLVPFISDMKGDCSRIGKCKKKKKKSCDDLCAVIVVFTVRLSIDLFIYLFIFF